MSAITLIAILFLFRCVVPGLFVRINQAIFLRKTYEKLFGEEVPLALLPMSSLSSLPRLHLNPFLLFYIFFDCFLVGITEFIIDIVSFFRDRSDTMWLSYIWGFCVIAAHGKNPLFTYERVRVLIPVMREQMFSHKLDPESKRGKRLLLKEEKIIRSVTELTKAIQDKNST